jgi:2-methylisocitrate lyase-like PEP mutase family enzyme
MKTQKEKGEAFRALHEREGAFIIPNPWDAGTARMLALMGFEALATTSAGNAFAHGKKDGAMGRDATLENAAAIVAAADVPVNGDLENGFGDSAEAAAKTIRMAAEAGLVGGSIEDATGRADDPIYRIEHAVERVQAAAEAAHALPFPFTLTARAENYLHGREDLRDTIYRLRLYQEAGADVLYAPGLKTKEEIEAVVSSVERPVNVLMGIGDLQLSLKDLSSMGVRRVSVGGALCRLALGAFLGAAREMKERGKFGFTKKATKTQTILEALGL